MAVVYYISHPQVAIDLAVPVPRWGLSALGRARLDTLEGTPWVRDLALVVASDETKAIETARRLAEIAACPTRVDPAMHENDRSSTGYLPPAEFEAMADQFFARPDEAVRGWEPARAAQARIVAAVERVLAGDAPAGDIAFSGHGGVGTLLFCHLAEEPIRRLRDQPPGGGNVFAFDRETRRPLFPWTVLERVADTLR